jgi:hypothetical protein
MFRLDDGPLATHKVPYCMEFATLSAIQYRYPRCSFIYIPSVWPLLQINTPVRILGPRLQRASSSLSVMYTWARKERNPCCASNRPASLLSSGRRKWNTEETNRTGWELFEYYSVNPNQNMADLSASVHSALVSNGIKTKINTDLFCVYFTHTDLFDMTFRLSLHTLH